MNALIVLLLAVLWVSILAPGALRGRRTRSPLSSVHDFERRMGVLAASGAGRAGRSVLAVAGPAPLTGPAAARRRTLARRRALLKALAGAVVASAVLAVVLGPPFSLVLAGAVAALGGYVGLLVRLRIAAERSRATVRHLPVEPAPGPEDGAPAAARTATASVLPAAVGGGAG